MSINESSSLASILGGFEEYSPLDGANPLAITLAAAPRSLSAAPSTLIPPIQRNVHIPGPAGIIAQRLACGLPPAPDQRAWMSQEVPVHEEKNPDVDGSPAWRAALDALDVSAGASGDIHSACTVSTMLHGVYCAARTPPLVYTDVHAVLGHSVHSVLTGPAPTRIKQLLVLITSVTVTAAGDGFAIVRVSQATFRGTF